MQTKNIRKFKSGATRDTDDTKLDFEGHLSPIVLIRYVEFLDKKRKLPDGTRRPSDNWQLGIPRDEYMKSMARHFMETWKFHRENRNVDKEQKIEALCALLFNVMGYLHEEIKK